MQKNVSVQKLTSAAILIALGIVIPFFSPLKIVLPPASFTVASHVPLFLAIFISPAVAAAVAAGTTLGFFLGSFPLVIVLRAATHIVFALLGAFFLQKYSHLLNSFAKTQLFSFVLGVIHGACEVAIVSVFYAGGGAGELFYSQGFLYSVVFLVGVGSIVHSMVDFGIAYAILKALTRQKSIKKLFQYS